MDDYVYDVNTLNNFISELKSINVRLNNLNYHESDDSMGQHYDRVCNGLEFLIHKYKEKSERIYERVQESS